MHPKAYWKAPLAALLEWQAMAEGAYSANTRRRPMAVARPQPGRIRLILWVGKRSKEFIDGARVGLRADRERALLCVAYETLARRGELVALEIRDIAFHPNGWAKRSFGEARRIWRGRGGWRTCHGRR